MSSEIKLAEVPCQVSQGMFKNEISVSIDLPDGTNVDGVFDKSYATSDKVPETGELVDGRFRVEIIEEDDDTALIQFTRNPNQHLWANSPSRAIVPKDFLLASN